MAGLSRRGEVREPARQYHQSHGALPSRRAGATLLDLLLAGQAVRPPDLRLTPPPPLLLGLGLQSRDLSRSTVLVDGRRVNACLTLAVMKDGSKITTIEGLATDGALHPLQQAFIDHDAFQCGYCTSGQICSAAGLIAEGRARTADDIRELMSGNICRCAAYPNIVAAIQQAMTVMGSKP